MKWALVNGEYEYELFRDILGPLPRERIVFNRKDVEYIFFFLNRDPELGLHAEHTYREEYLRRLESLGLTIPEIGKGDDPVPWYGKLTDLATERKLNSKLWSHELLDSLNLAPGKHHIVSSRREAEAIMAREGKRSWLLKSPYQMCGSGMTNINPGDSIPEIHFPHILEPLYRRLLDVSWLYSPENQSVKFYINLVSPEGKYFGGLLFAREEAQEAYLAERGFLTAFHKFRDTSAPILRELRKENLQQNLSVDGFLFEGLHGPEVHPMCEINYRYTMGAMMHSLHRFLPENGVGAFYTLRNIPDLDERFMAWNSETRKGILYLTPPDSVATAFFICANTVKEAQTIARKFFELWTSP